ncbi:hypothetical protein [Methylobacterium phyllostachyos]|nr:hypothetical protein [Methylobacterium phyllostachyos]
MPDSVNDAILEAQVGHAVGLLFRRAGSRSTGSWTLRPRLHAALTEA